MMQRNEWTLVVFTLMIQAAAGLLLVVSAFNSWTLLSEQKPAVEPIAQAATVAALLSLLGGGVASLHLANPRNGWRAFLNVKTSWLSREIFVTVIFSGILTLGALASILAMIDLKGVMIVCGISAILGLVAVCVMSKVYMVRTIPPWNSWTTPAEFISSSILLGLIQYLFILAGHEGSVEIFTAENILPLLITFCVAVKLFFAQRIPVSQIGTKRSFSEHCNARLILLLSALLLLFAALIYDSCVALWVSGILLLLSELKGRLHFFDSVYKVGL